MDKKDLKWYESPVMETVDVEVEGQILAGSPNPDDPFDGKTEEPEEV